MSFNSIAKATAVALTLCVAIPATATLAQAKVCKSYTVKASGAKKLTNLSARVSARWAWHKKVQHKLGLIWSTYALAKNKGYNCHRVGVKWRCEAYGRPCRPGN